MLDRSNKRMAALAITLAAAMGDGATQMQQIYNAKRTMNTAIFGVGGTSPNPSEVIPAIP